VISPTRLALHAAGELASLLADRTDALIPVLLPAARHSGGYWHVGNIDGDPGRSLYVHRHGVKTGRWTDAATDQSGDLLDLINAALFGGRDLQTAMRWAFSWLGLDCPGPTPIIPLQRVRPRRFQGDDDERAISVARKIWNATDPVPGTKAETYLWARAIGCALPPTLRFAPALRHHPTDVMLPALLAAISGPDGQVTAVQRIYLRPNGLGKADVPEPRMTLGRMRDGACRLAPADRELGLAEGVETGLSAMELYCIPVWVACGSRMACVAIPEKIRRLIIFADGDAAGIMAAERAAVAHERQQREVAIVYPPAPHKDWNDLAIADAAGTVVA